MGLLDDVQRRASIVQRKCTVAVIFDVLDENDRADLRHALADPGISTLAILEVLKQRGHRIAATTITKHRKGVCTCR